ncbi:hypothetical protein SIO70_15685 [Chitinophaga sancti]|uniref:hypothetical protein n=1 Tax=Chitinophaga sancti TaxID=1004 RepID=UPI002A75AC14|nr:hypothetical protein [Chitinophaga sancti]WPQ66302.1 hypothetical protein SIO70_15685 [Chitinophaga sancti]
MLNYKFILKLSLFPLIMLYACGGVLGHIERYKFENISPSRLQTVVANYLSIHKEYSSDKFKSVEIVPDTYEYYITIRDGSSVYKMAYIFPKYDPPYDTIAEITLTTAGPIDKPLKLSGDLGFFEKRKYQKLFKEYFIEKIKREL